MMKSLKKECLSECYVDVKNLIYDTAHKFKRQYGGDVEEYISIGNLAFVNAYDSYHEKHAGFVTWVRFIMWKTLLNHINKERRSKRSRPKDRIISEQCRPLIELLDELDDDAKNVTELILSTPADLHELFQLTDGSGRQIKQTLSTYLTNTGWSAARIHAAFTRIKVAL